MRKTIDDLLNDYVEEVKRLDGVENAHLVNARMEEVNRTTIQPMIVMINKLPADVRRQFIKSKCKELFRS